MAPKLPNHLASLLRHQPASASASTDAEETGKTARKKAARIKRRAKAKEDRAAEREEKLRRLQEELRQKAETKVDPPKDETPKKKKKKLLPKKKKLTAAIPRAREGTKVPKDESKASASLFDPEGAARDASLLHDLEKKLGIAGNSKRRRKEEKQIFQDLFEEEDLGIEELPSSDENETAQASSVEGLKESDIVGLLDTILGQGEMTSTSSIKTQGSKSKKRKS